MIKGIHLDDADKSNDINLIFHALDFASRAHEGVKRDDDSPYITHPISVLRILVESPWPFKTEELAGAILHDVIEDTTTPFQKIKEKFNERVAALVWLLSKPKNIDMATEIYWSAIGECGPTVIAIKLADIYHNLTTCELEKDPSFAPKFKSKIKKYGLVLIEKLKCHGDCWHEYADWIGNKIKSKL